MKNKQYLKEVKHFQKLAGILKEWHPDKEWDETPDSDEGPQENTGYKFQDPEFKKVAIPVMNDMLMDCLDNYNGDFNDWVENGMSQPSHDVEAGLEALEQMSSPEEVDKFIAAAYRQIQGYIKKHG